MSWYDTWFEQYIEPAFEELDGYDFTNILSDCYDNGHDDSWTIQEAIESAYPELIKEGHALDIMSNDDLQIYLASRYPVKFEQHITYHMRYE